jgi:FkbM family methyltransferase
MRNTQAKLGRKLSNLGEILQLPGGWGWKRKIHNFHWKDYRMCLRLRQSGISPSTIIDVGGNEGQFTLGARLSFPEAEIHVYEPGKEAFGRMEKLLSTHGLEAGIHLHRKALGDREGKATLRVTNHDQSSSMLALHANHLAAFPEVKEDRTEEVTMGTLEKEIEKMAPKGPILLKIDTQGFEMSVLKGAGAALSKVSWVLLETATRPMYEDEVLFPTIMDWMAKQGLTFVGPVEVNCPAHTGPVQFDALFARS